MNRFYQRVQAISWIDQLKISEFAQNKKQTMTKAKQIMASNDMRHLLCSEPENGYVTVSGYVHSEYKSVWYKVILKIPQNEGLLETSCVCKRRYEAYKKIKHIKLKLILLSSPQLCIHTVSILYAIVLYRDHAMDPVRPAWAKLKGTRFQPDSVLEMAGIITSWVGFLNKMVDPIEDKDQVWNTKPVPKKRGRKKKTD